MYRSIINFKVKKWIHPHKPVIGMFLESWIEETTTDYEWNYTSWDGPEFSGPQTMAIECERSEDAMALKLRGLPKELNSYFQLQ